MSQQRRTYSVVDAELFPVVCEECELYIGLGTTYFVHTSDPVHSRRVDENLCEECHTDRCRNDSFITEYGSWCTDAMAEASKMLDKGEAEDAVEEAIRLLNDLWKKGE